MAIRRRPKAEIKARVAQLLDLVGLSGFENRRASLLSGGQMQRIALARSLTTRPRALLLDEPLSNLDAKLRERLRFELREIQKQFEITSIYVTHDQDEALALADRIGIMKDGILVQIESPIDLYRSPVNTFAASFMGMDSIIDGIVESVFNGHAMVRLNDGSIIQTTSVKLSIGQKVYVCARSEELFIVDDNEITGNIVHAEVLSSNFRGDRVRLHLRLGSDHEIYATSPPLEMSNSAGDQVCVYFPPDKVIALVE